jgi:protein SCO1/2
VSSPELEQPQDSPVRSDGGTLGGRGSRPSRRPLFALAPVVVMIGLLALVTVTLLHTSSKPKLPSNASAGRSRQFAGLVAKPVKPAPAIALRNYLGRPVTLSAFRGKAALVTFLYTHCPDVCPLITENLKAALAQAPAVAGRVQIVAVSVDPKGDTPRAVADFLRRHSMIGRMQYLIGSPAELAPVWASWYVGSSSDATNPAHVAHSALVYGITATGRLLTIYPATFSPAEVAHDVPLLASR